MTCIISFNNKIAYSFKCYKQKSATQYFGMLFWWLTDLDCETNFTSSSATSTKRQLMILYLVAILREGGKTSNLKPAPNNKKDIKNPTMFPTFS